jgi:hypothetical protein
MKADFCRPGGRWLANQRGAFIVDPYNLPRFKKEIEAEKAHLKELQYAKRGDDSVESGLEDDDC